MSPKVKKPTAVARAQRKRKKKRKKAWPAGTMLHLTKDKPAKNLVYGPNHTPHRHHPKRRPKMMGATLSLDQDKLISLAFSPELDAALVRLEEHDRDTARLQMLAALALTAFGKARAIVLVVDDDGSIAVACKWPWRKWQQPRPWEPIHWSEHDD